MKKPGEREREREREWPCLRQRPATSRRVEEKKKIIKARVDEECCKGARNEEREAIVETSLDSTRYSRPTKLLMAMERSRIPATT